MEAEGALPYSKELTPPPPFMPTVLKSLYILSELLQNNLPTQDLEFYVQSNKT
jgi:hypothetical protein